MRQSHVCCLWLILQMHVNNIAGCLKSIAKLRLNLLIQMNQQHQLLYLMVMIWKATIFPISHSIPPPHPL
uniref:Secreted protein n=1 Tax=Gossypium raimondii TaxID=29730 RepID=A0A0D2SCK6_GOSRA|nr:hypothetical protein B456_009G332300 [Gossypium raimondii]